jgi:hypothetical protein
MGGHGRNGNITKGNKGKKGRRRVNPYSELEEGFRYGRIYVNNGQHVQVELPTENEEGEKIVSCRIPGKMWKKVWFNKNDYVVIGGKFSDKIYELAGRVMDSELNYVKKMFDKTDDTEDIGIQIGGDENEVDEDHDDMILGVRSRVSVSSKPKKSEAKVSISTKKTDGDESDSDSIGSIDLDDL